MTYVSNTADHYACVLHEVRLGPSPSVPLPPPRAPLVLQVIPGVYTSNLDQVLPVVRKDPAKAAEVKFFVGYAGWSAGQLQRTGGFP